MTYSRYNDPDPRSEMTSLLLAGLGHSIEDHKVAALAAMREHLQDEADRLSDLVMAKEITPERYLSELDEALIEASRIGERILGYEDFHRVFGELRVARLGDAKLFLEQYYSGR
jgi:hypothetical protein